MNGMNNGSLLSNQLKSSKIFQQGSSKNDGNIFYRDINFQRGNKDVVEGIMGNSLEQLRARQSTVEILEKYKKSHFFHYSSLVDDAGVECEPKKKKEFAIKSMFNTSLGIIINQQQQTQPKNQQELGNIGKIRIAAGTPKSVQENQFFGDRSSPFSSNAFNSSLKNFNDFDKVSEESDSHSSSPDDTHTKISTYSLSNCHKISFENQISEKISIKKKVTIDDNIPISRKYLDSVNYSDIVKVEKTTGIGLQDKKLNCNGNIRNIAKVQGVVSSKVVREVNRGNCVGFA